MLRPAAALLLAVLALDACSKTPDDSQPGHGPVAAVAAPAGTSWVETVSATFDGGYRMGNPNAPVKLVEYGSLTCPHCKAFTAEGGEALKRSYIASGRVSWEFRPFLIHSPDPMATLLVACRGAQTFFPLAEQVFAAQDVWLGKLIAVPAKTQERWQQLAPADQFQAMATASGLKSFLAARGLPPAQADRCLADPAGASRLVAIRDKASNLGVTGTPAFLINGQLVDGAVEWSQLEPRLKDALG